MIRFFTEPALEPKIEILHFAQNDRRRVQNDHPWPWKGKYDISLIMTQPQKGRVKIPQRLRLRSVSKWRGYTLVHVSWDDGPARYGKLKEDTGSEGDIL